MKRFVSALLTLSLICTLGFPAYAVGNFTDVPSGAWYAGYVDACYEAGLLKGVGDEKFDPEGTVTIGQAMMAAVRIYDLQNGGDGNIPELPEGGAKGLVYFTDLDGNRVASFDDMHMWGLGDTNLPLLFEDDAMQRLRDKEKPLDTIIMVCLIDGEKSFTGTYYVDEKDGLGRYLFVIPEGQGVGAFLGEELAYLVWAYEDFVGHWAESAYYYWDRILANMPEEKEETLYEMVEAIEPEYPELRELLNTPEPPFDEPCPRAMFAVFLYACIPEDQLSPINDVGPLPEFDTEGLRTLYNAGIIGGVDDAGTFNGSETLTRAQLAAIIARVIDPTLRLN